MLASVSPPPEYEVDLFRLVSVQLYEVEIESIREMLATAAKAGHIY